MLTGPLPSPGPAGVPTAVHATPGSQSATRSSLWRIIARAMPLNADVLKKLASRTGLSIRLDLDRLRKAGIDPDAIIVSAQYDEA